MTKHLLFLQGGAGDEDHQADAKLVDSLQKALGRNYTIHYPLLPEEPSPDFGRMKQIEKELSLIDGEIVLVAHSLGASMLLKYFSEYKTTKKIAAIFLLSTPFWSGNEDWKQGLKLREDFAARLPKDLRIFLYHCRDDESVPFEHLGEYSKKIGWATIREIQSGGHQFNDDLSIVAKDIKLL